MSKWAILLSSKYGVQALAVTGLDDPSIKLKEEQEDFVKWLDMAESTKEEEN